MLQLKYTSNHLKMQVAKQDNLVGFWFVCFDFFIPVTIFQLCRDGFFFGLTSFKQWIKCLAQ